MSASHALDQTAALAFAEKVLGDFAGLNACLVAGLGDRLGLFAELASGGPATPGELAARATISERYAREWLAAMNAAGYLVRDPATGRHELPPEHVPALADDGGPLSMVAAFELPLNASPELYSAIVRAFRTGRGVPQAAYAPGIFDAAARLSASWFNHLLTQEWLPAVPEIDEALEQGGRVADVGCGKGLAAIRIAQAYPKAQVIGYDRHAPLVEEARVRSAEAGVADRVRFEVRDVAGDLGESFDVVTAIDVVHDAGDPRGLLAAIRRALRPGGRLLCVEFAAAEHPEDNVGPVATVMYGSSLVYCLNVALAEGEEGLGTLGLPESRMAELGRAAGFAEVRRVTVDAPLHALFELIA